MKCKTCRGHGFTYPIVGGNGNGIETVCPDCKGTGQVQLSMTAKAVIVALSMSALYGLLMVIALILHNGSV